MKNKRFTLALALMVSFDIGLTTPASASSTGPAAAPAPMFGLNFANTGQSSYFGITSLPRIQWTLTLPQNRADYSLTPLDLALSSNGLLYTLGGYALQASSGSVVWQGSGGRDTGPALDNNGTEYAYEGGTLRARNASTGSVLWSLSTNASDGEPVRIGPDGTVYGSTFAGLMYAATPTGTLKWQTNYGSPQYGLPSLQPAFDSTGDLFFCGASGLRSLDPSGNTRWTIAYAPQTTSRVMLAPTGDVIWQRDGLVEERNPNTGALDSSFTPPAGSTLEAMDSAGDLYFTSGYDIYKTTLSGSSIWTFAHNYIDAPITVDAAGDVYAGTQQGQILALNSSGQQLWELQYGSSTAYMGNVAPVLGPNGTLYLLDTEDQKIVGITAVPEPDAMALIALTTTTTLLARRRR
jgi:hypothetical protein